MSFSEVRSTVSGNRPKWSAPDQVSMNHEERRGICFDGSYGKWEGMAAPRGVRPSLLTMATGVLSRCGEAGRTVNPEGRFRGSCVEGLAVREWDEMASAGARTRSMFGAEA